VPHARFGAVVKDTADTVVFQPHRRPIGRGGNRALACASADDGDAAMVDRQRR